VVKQVFYSFHYQRDAVRVQQILNNGAFAHQEIPTSQQWEELGRRGDAAIARWIDEQMVDKDAVVVLVGAETSTRPWVKYEITKAWNERVPLVGVRVHGLADSRTGRDSDGASPFRQIRMTDGRTIADYVKLHDPVGSTGFEVYASITENLEGWIDAAYRRV
jgi:hypothetical protein